jgi:uncharacterized membrane protein YidH (DUF202 family)
MNFLYRLAARTIQFDKNTGELVRHDGFFTGDFASVFGRITNVLIFLLGAVSILVLVITGFKFVISTGDPQKTRQAWDAIIYAAVGLVVALAAFAIVSYIRSQAS